MLFTLHELEIVDDDETEILHTAKLCFHTGDGHTCGIVDEDARFRKVGGGIGELFVLLGGKVSRTDRIAIHQCFAGEHTVGKLFGGHFEGEDADRLFCFQRGGGGDVHRKAGFPHPGTCADEDKVAVAHADDDVVEVIVAGGGTAQFVGIFGKFGQAFVYLQESVADMDEILVFASFRDAEDLGFGVFDEAFGFSCAEIFDMNSVMSKIYSVLDCIL